MADIQQLPAEKAPVGDSPIVEITAHEDLHNNLLEDALKPPSNEKASLGSSSRPETKQALSDALLAKGIMPALDEKDISQTLAKAAKAMAGNDLGVASDGGKSSGTSISRLLQAVGADIKQTGLIPDLKAQLEKLGWESIPMGGPLKPGDLVFTSMDPMYRNVGVVGEDGRKIYSHNFRSHSFEGRENWTSRFTTIMRPKDNN